MNLPDENEKRFVAIVNKKIELGKLMNALGHCATGLASSYKDHTELCILPYSDKENNTHGPISHFPFIVLKAENSNQIRSVKSECVARGIPFSDFTHTMTLGTTEEQLTATLNKTDDELEYYSIVLFGKTEEIKQFTRKFSLLH